MEIFRHFTSPSCSLLFSYAVLSCIYFFQVDKPSPEAEQKLSFYEFILHSSLVSLCKLLDCTHTTWQRVHYENWNKLLCIRWQIQRFKLFKSDCHGTRRDHFSVCFLVRDKFKLRVQCDIRYCSQQCDSAFKADEKCNKIELFSASNQAKVMNFFTSIWKLFCGWGKVTSHNFKIALRQSLKSATFLKPFHARQDTLSCQALLRMHVKLKFCVKKTFMTMNRFYISRNGDFSFYNSLNAFNYSLKFSRNTSFKNNISHLSTMEKEMWSCTKIFFIAKHYDNADITIKFILSR